MTQKCGEKHFHSIISKGVLGVVKFSQLIRSSTLKNRFNVNLKNWYDKWVDEGKPELTAGKIDQLLNETQEMDLEDNNTNLPAPFACTPSCNNTPNTVTIHGKKEKTVSFFVSNDNPSEMQPLNHFQSTSGTPSPSTSSFKEMTLRNLMLCKHLKLVNHLRNSKSKSFGECCYLQ